MKSLSSKIQYCEKLFIPKINACTLLCKNLLDTLRQEASDNNNNNNNNASVVRTHRTHVVVPIHMVSVTELGQTV